MKKRRIIPALVITLAIGIGVTAYAASSGTAGSSTPGQRLGIGKITSMRGYDYMTNILKNRLGISDADITNALNAGKTLYDLAAEKGMTQEELKKIMLEEKSKAIDDAVAAGTISKEQGETLKTNLNTNLQSCTGNLGGRMGQGQGQRSDQGCGQGRGVMGNRQGKGCLYQGGTQTNQ